MTETGVDWPRAVAAHADAERLWVQLADGRELSLPLSWFDFLGEATEKQRQNLRVIEGGAGLWWDEVDEGVSVPRLLGLPEDPPPDPDVRSYVVDYRAVEDGWDADVRGTAFSTWGPTIVAAKKRARELLRGYLNVRDLAAAGIQVVDEVHASNPARV